MTTRFDQAIPFAVVAVVIALVLAQFLGIAPDWLHEITNSEPTIVN